MTTTFLPNGVGGSVGSQTAYAKPLYLTGTVYYVDSQTGTDAPAYGLDRAHPFATLAYALGGTTADGDIVVMLDGHEETIATSITVDDKITILGEGSSSGVPGVELTLGHASNDMFTVTDAARFENITFKPFSSASAASYIYLNTGSDGSEMEGCRFELNGNSNASGVDIEDIDGIRIKDCVFVSTATAITDRPAPGVTVNGAAEDLEIDGTTFDGGTAGWGGTYDAAVDAVPLDAPLRLMIRNASLLRGSDIFAHEDTTGHVSVGVNTGSSRVVWQTPGL